MRELNAGNGSMCFYEPGDAGQRFYVIVRPDADVFWRNAPISGNGSRLDDDQANSADGATAKVDEVKVIGVAVIRGIHAHRRHRDSVAEGDTSDRYWSKEVDFRHFSIVIAMSPAGATGHLAGEIFNG